MQLQRCLSLLFFLFCCAYLSAQTPAKYYTTIHQAEAFILADKFAEALPVYEKAFKLKNPFSNDLFNAFSCAVRTKQFEKATVFARQLMLLGCKIEFFREREQFNSYTASGPWIKLVAEYPVLWAKYDKKINWRLRYKLEELYEKDQFLRRQDPTYTIFPDSTFNLDREIVDELLGLIKTEGFPSEEKVGVFVSQDTTLNYLRPLTIILVHNYTESDVYKKGFDLTDVLMAEVQNGNFHPDAFSLLNDRAGSFMINKGFGREGLLWKFNDKFYFEKLSQKSMDMIDKERASIWLPSLKQMRSMGLYQLEHSDFSFFYDSLVFMADMPEEIIQRFFCDIDCDESCLLLKQ